MTADESQSPTAADIYLELLKVPPGPRPPDHYALLGVRRFEDDVRVIHANVLRCSSIVRKYALTPERVRRERIQELLNEIGRAGVVLEDPNQRQAYNGNFPDWVPPVQSTAPTIPPVIAAPPRIVEHHCPHCRRQLTADAVICVVCGYDLVGHRLLTTQGDEPPARPHFAWKRIVVFGLAGIGVMVVAVAIRNYVSSRSSNAPAASVTSAAPVVEKAPTAPVVPPTPASESKPTGVTGSAARTVSSGPPLISPTDLAVDDAGNLVVVDSNRILKVTAAGIMTALAVTPGDSGEATGPNGVVQFNALNGVAVDRAGNVFVADTGTHHSQGEPNRAGDDLGGERGGSSQHRWDWQ